MNQVLYTPMEHATAMGQNKKYKKIRVKKQKLKGKSAQNNLLFAADKADLVVEEYTDEVSVHFMPFLQIYTTTQ